jgi:hypothetical protein
MSNITQILMRGDGRTVYGTADSVKVRFDTPGDRARFESQLQLLDLVSQEDVAGAARLVVQALTDGTVDDIDDLLTSIRDEESEEIIRLQVETCLDENMRPMVDVIKRHWRPDE